MRSVLYLAYRDTHLANQGVTAGDLDDHLRDIVELAKFLNEKFGIDSPVELNAISG